MGFRSRVLSSVMARRPRRLALSRGTLSVSFDDFPRSAWVEGGAVLRDFDAQATYYACMGLAGSQRAGGEHFTVDDLMALHDEGHEVGDHGYDHLVCEDSPLAEVLADVEHNQRALGELIGHRPRHFAYPKGSMTPWHKRALSERFTSLRGVWPGINGGSGRPFNAAALRAVPLYAKTWNSAAIGAWMSRAAATRGWLVVFTHDVSTSPGPWGITPTQLAQTLTLAHEAGLRIAPVGEVLGTHPATARTAVSAAEVEVTPPCT